MTMSDHSSGNSGRDCDVPQMLITAAFFMEGLHDARPAPAVPANYDVLIETWGKGCVELVDALVSYVPLTIRLCNAAASANDDLYPGVFDYEVSSPFGKWFGEFILQHGNAPSQAEADSWLAKEVAAFFTQGISEEEVRSVHAAIQNQIQFKKETPCNKKT
jgi:hypothetical protein